MKVIGKTNEGKLLVEMSEGMLVGWERLQMEMRDWESTDSQPAPAPVRTVPELPEGQPAPAEISPPRVTVRKKRGPYKKHAHPRQDSDGQAVEDKKIYPCHLRRRAEMAKKRNKKCRKCGDAFFDESRTNCRKWCGENGCKRADTEKKGRALSRDTDAPPARPSTMGL